MWEIKKIVKKGDYLYAVVPDHPRATKNKYVLHHRVVVENNLGRLLDSFEVVHHINGDKKDNRIENLEVMTSKEHTIHHVRTGRTMVTLSCAHCGKVFEREKRQVKGKGLCSRKCNGLFNSLLQNWHKPKK